ncbi:MAG: alpha/beta hydrolase [Bacteroidota bacterium]|nr:alpha/beta hydrolase [Bacteroidota bacterium]
MKNIYLGKTTKPNIFKMKEQSVIYQQRRINYYLQGDVSKRTIVFIHGNSLSAKTFSEQFNGIKNIPLLALDLPGHGLSEKALSADKTYSILGYIEVLKHVISELQLTDFILVGHSLGGHIVLEASEELDGLKGLVLFGSPPLGMPPEMDKAFLPNPAIPFLFKEQLSENEINLLCEALTDIEHKEKIKNEIQIADGDTRSFLAASFAKGQFKNEIELIKNLSVPVAIIYGENDSLISKQYLSELTIPTLWKKEIHLIKNARHSPQMEQANEFNKLISDFYYSI